MPKLKKGTVLPTLEEDADITAAAFADPDAMPFDAAAWAQVKPRVGRPPAQVTKERITIRLSRDVVGRFRASGPGWQSRLDGALKEWLHSHPLV